MFKTEITYQNPLTDDEFTTLGLFAAYNGVMMELSENRMVLSIYTRSRELGARAEAIINKEIVDYGPQCLITPPHPCNEI
jgi:hypothetical protein